MSYPEVLLWQRLRGSPMGVRFRRQHPIGPDCVADFYCPAARVVVEIDGEIHSHSVKRDRVRDRYLAERGLRVIRVPARDVLRDADGTANAIVALVAAAPPPSGKPDGPPPRTGEDQE